MKEIPLTQGMVALVDDVDYENLSQYRWCVARMKHGTYAVRSETIAPNRKRRIYMHRAILSVSADQLVDHKDGNGLNNQRSNLRPASYRQNAANRKKKIAAPGKYKGVDWHPRLSRWQARIMVKGRRIYLGSFASQEDAAQAYDEAARQLLGDFAYTNIANGMTQKEIEREFTRVGTKITA